MERFSGFSIFLPPKNAGKPFNIQDFIIPLQPIYINNIKSNTISYLKTIFLFNGKLKEHCSY